MWGGDGVMLDDITGSLNKHTEIGCSSGGGKALGW